MRQFISNQVFLSRTGIAVTVMSFPCPPTDENAEYLMKLQELVEQMYELP